MLRGLFLVLAVGLLALALLTVVRAWNTTLWKLALVAGEYGHFAAILALVVGCAALAQVVVLDSSRGQVWVSSVAVVASLAAVGLFLSPTYYAARVAAGLPAKLDAAFPPKKGPSNRLRLGFGTMLDPRRGETEVPVSTHVFAYDGTADALALDYYQPVRKAEESGPVPCVVVIHGGGWDSGDRTQMAGFNHWLASRGYAVAAISYRLAPRFRWPAQRDDTLAAIGWLKAHAGELGFDGSRLVLFGRSAGAQIAAAVGYGVPDPAIRGVIGFYGVYDMEFVWSIAREDDVLNSVNLMNQFLGGGPTMENQAEYDSASAQSLVVTGRTPPTLLMHGTIDTLCWVRHSERLAKRLEEAKVPHVLVELPWAVHAFEINRSGPAGQLTTYAVERFLGSVTRSGENL